MSSSFLIRKKYFEDLGTANVPKFLVGKKTTEHTYSTCSDTVALKLGITLHPGEGTVEKDHITLIAGSKFTLPEVVPPGSLVLASWYKDAGFTMPAIDGTKVDITFSNLYANYVELDDCTIFETTLTSDVSISKILLDSRYDKLYVDWGDGLVQTFKATQNDISHNYAASGKYTIKISKHVNLISITNNSGRASKIENIVLFSSNVTALPDYFAYHQSTLRSVNLAGIQTIGVWAFEDCSSATFTNYDSVRSFANGTFNRCHAITQFTVPRVTTSIGNDRWITSNSLTRLTVDPANTTFVDIGNIIYRPSDRKLYGACKSANFDFTTYDVQIDRLNLALKTLNISDKDIILPASLTGFDSYEFENIVAKSIDMSNCTLLTNLGTNLFAYIFNGTTLNESFTLPPNITMLCRNTFNNVKGNGFGTITLPPSFRKFDVYMVFNGPSNGAIKKVIFQNSEFDMSTPIDHPFNRCNELVTISLELIVDPNNIPPMQTSLFENDIFSNDLVIYVANEEMKTAFENATNWNKYAGRYRVRESGILELDYRNATSKLNITNSTVSGYSDVRIILPEIPPVDGFTNNAFASNLTELNTIRISGITNWNGYSTKSRALNNNLLTTNTQLLNVIFEGLTDLGYSADFTGSRGGAQYWCAGGFMCENAGLNGGPVEYHFPDVTRIDFSGANSSAVLNCFSPGSFNRNNRKFDMYFHKDLTYVDFNDILAHTFSDALPAGQTLCTIHFTEGSRSVIESSPNYNTKWKTNNLIVVFDL